MDRTNRPNVERHRARARHRSAAGALGLLVTMMAVAAEPPQQPIPFVKRATPRDGQVALAAARIVRADELRLAAASLHDGLGALGVTVGDAGLPIRLALADVEFPPSASKYRDEIVRQGYRLRVADDAITIEARSPQGVYYGVQTLLQLVTPARTCPAVDILDWPDLAWRMVMIDSARQNENADYYARLIRFLGRHKVNFLHWHLTDDENVALYHEDYPQLLHPNAWRAADVRELVELARAHYIEIIPEIESLGHARVFTRHPDYRDFLHQTTFDKPSRGWAGTDVPGYTNVLCPASARTYAYLTALYGRAAELFPFPLLHVGCDEVEQTTCARCAAAFGDIPFADWIARHLKRCHELAGKVGRKTALWGDMLLHHRDAVAGLPRESIIIFDWHYRRDVDPASAAFFSDEGFDVVGCPALVCHPRMILPDDENFANIAAFARVAREQDLHGLDTTIWTPTRYMADVVWPGVAFAAAQAWSGGDFDTDAFYAGFARDFFGLTGGPAETFTRAWHDVLAIRWWLNDFYAACWIDEKGLAEAQELAREREADIRPLLARLRDAEAQLNGLLPSVQRNPEVLATIARSIATRAYTMEHLLASRDVGTHGAWNREALRKLDAGCQQALAWMEEDWARNRFPGDPNQRGRYLPAQNLMWRFHQMHEFHRTLLGAAEGNDP